MMLSHFNTHNQNDTTKQIHRCEDKRSIAFSKQELYAKWPLPEETTFRSIRRMMTMTMITLTYVPANNTDRDNITGTGTAAASSAVGGNGTINFILRVEQNKIPELFGTKSKDILAADFIRRLEDLTRTN
jgi:hypothetical protein